MKEKSSLPADAAVNATIPNAKIFPKVGEFACQHSVSSLCCQISFMLESFIKGYSENTEELTDMVV